MKKSNNIYNWAEAPVGLTPKQTSWILNVSEDEVRLLCRQGKIKATKVSPRRWIIPKSWLMDFIEGGADHE